MQLCPRRRPHEVVGLRCIYAVNKSPSSALKEAPTLGGRGEVPSQYFTAPRRIGPQTGRACSPDRGERGAPFTASTGGEKDAGPPAACGRRAIILSTGPFESTSVTDKGHYRRRHPTTSACRSSRLRSGSAWMETHATRSQGSLGPELRCTQPIAGHAATATDPHPADDANQCLPNPIGGEAWRPSSELAVRAGHRRIGVHLAPADTGLSASGQVPNIIKDEDGCARACNALCRT